MKEKAPLLEVARWAQTMPALTTGLAAASLLHIGYVGINLAAFLEPAEERFFLWGYPVAALMLALFILHRALRPPETPVMFLERRLDLGYRLINAHRGLSGERVPEILGGMAFSSLWKRLPWRSWVLFLSVPTLVLLAHVALPALTLRFLSNTRSLLDLGVKPYSIQAPATLLEGETFRFSWDGEWEWAQFGVEGKGQGGNETLPRGRAFSLSSVKEDLSWTLTLHQGRTVKAIGGETRVLKRPRLVALHSVVVDPTGRLETSAGVPSLSVWAGSSLTWNLDFGSNQNIQGVMGLPPGVAVRVLGSRVTLSQNPVPPGAQSFDLTVTNERGQGLESRTLLQVQGRPNEAPVVSLTAGAEELRPHLRATDDLGLKHLALLRVDTGARLWEREGKGSRDVEMDTEVPTLTLSPGERVSVVAEAEDLLGLVTRSSPLALRRAGATERTEASLARVDNLKVALGTLVEGAQRLERSSEEARLLAERGQLTAEKAKALTSQSESLRQQVADLQKAISAEMTLAQREATLMADPEVSRRLKDISEALKTLDEQTLRQLEGGNRALMEQMAKQAPDPEAWKRASEQLTAARISSRLEALKAAIESLRRAQTLEELARLAEGLYQKGQDLRSKSLRDDNPGPWNRARPDMAREVEDLTQAWKNRQNEAAPPGADPLADELRKQVDRDLADLKKSLERDTPASNSGENLSGQTRAMDQLRRNLQALTRRERGRDLEAWLDEARRQMGAALALAAEGQAWSKGEKVDPLALTETRRRESARHLGEAQAWAESSRRALAAQLAPSMPHLLPQLDAWREMEGFLKSQARRLDPASSGPGLIPQVGPDTFLQERGMALDLARRLEALMKRSKEENENGSQGQEGSEGMEGLSKAQSRLSRRSGEQLGSGSGTSPAQDAYLKELALEQAMLRQMLNRMGQSPGGEGNPSPGGINPKAPGEGPGQKGPSAGEALMKELTESMKRAEEALAKGGAARDKILAEHKQIEANMLKATKGMKERDDERSEERESRSATNGGPVSGQRAVGNTTPGGDSPWQSLEGAPDYWAKRMRAFMEGGK